MAIEAGRLQKMAGAAVLLALSIACYILVWNNCVKQTEGHFTYALDDPYIHLAIARNFAFHGVWGVTEYINSAASSSPLWIVLLCIALRITGDWAYWPVVFGIGFSVAATLLAYSRFLKSGIAMPFAVAGSIAVFAVAPFHILPFTGMEHSLQIFLDLLFAFWLLDAMGREGDAKDFKWAILLSALICTCRFESAFLIAVPFAACVWRRDWRLALGLAIGPVLAIGGFALFSHALGMPYLPNSIVLKGRVPYTFSVEWFQALYIHLRGGSLAVWDLFLICVFAGLAFRLTGLRKSTLPLQVLLWTVVVATILHAGLAVIGIFYRYEAYLVVMEVTVIILSLREFIVYVGLKDTVAVSKPFWLATIAVITLIQYVLAQLFWFYQLSLNLIVSIYGVGLVALSAMALGATTRGRLVRSIVGSIIPLALFFIIRDRALQAYAEIPAGSRDVYLQQYQMARFVSRYHSNGRLVANDIGALTYFNHVHLLDLWGLASDGVRKLKVAGNWTSPTIKEQVEGFKPDLAILYPQWFQNARQLPSSLIQVATWTIPSKTSAARRIVMFYAPNTKAAEALKAELVEFQPSLPTAVTVEYAKNGVIWVPVF